MRGGCEIGSGGAGGRCLLFNPTRARGFAASSPRHPLRGAPLDFRSATDAMTPPVRRALLPAADQTERVRPRLAGDDGKRRNEQGGSSGPSTAVITKTKPQTKRPNLYRVLLLNDDYTPMEFVVHVLERFFNKDREAATRIMLHVHHHGIGECGVFTYEIAETKVTQVMDFARK